MLTATILSVNQTKLLAYFLQNNQSDSIKHHKIKPILPIPHRYKLEIEEIPKGFYLFYAEWVKLD